MANLEAWIAEKCGPDLSKVTEIPFAPYNITGKVFVPSRPSPLSQVAGGRMNKIPKHFLVPFKLPRSLTPALPALSILFHTGDIQVLGKCTQLTSVDFNYCKNITGGFLLEEGSSQSCGPVRFFWKNLSSMRILREFSRVARRTCRKFLEFFSLYSTLSLTHLPCLLANPIPFRRHPSA